MKNLSPEQIKKAFDEIPPELSTAISRINTDKIIQELGKKYNLHVDKIGLLDGLIPLVFVGLLDPEEFSQEIEQNLDLSVIQSPLLISEINEKIFMPVREKMKEIEEINQPIDETLYEEEPAPEPNNSVPIDLPVVPPPPTDEHTILKNAEIELEKPQGSVISEALDLSRAQMINRDTLMQSIENPPPSATSLPQKIIEKPVAVGIANAVQVPKIIQNQNIANIKMEEPKPFVGMPKSPGEAEKMFEKRNNQSVSAPAGNIVAQKLQRTFNIPKQQSNYTLPSIKGEPAKQTDLYREPI